MDQLMCAYFFLTHNWYEVSILEVQGRYSGTPAVNDILPSINMFTSYQ